MEPLTRAFSLWVLAASLLMGALPAAASCLGSGDADIEALTQDIGRQPFQALEAIERALAPDRALTPEQRAWLEGARAHAQRMVGSDMTVLAAALEGAKVLPTEHPARLHLQILRLYGSTLSPATRETMEALRQQLAAQPPDRPATLCAKIRLASAMAEHDRLNGESFELAAEVYRRAATEPLAWMRAEAASILGQVTLRTDTVYAQTLSAEALRYFESQAMHDMAANELFMDALASTNLMDSAPLQHAERQFRRSEEAALRAQNPYAAAYAQSGLCEVLTPLGRVQEALAVCASSLRQIQDSRNLTTYSTLISHAAALLAANHPREAMDLLALMARDWSDWHTGYHGYRFYDVRGRAQAALGKPREAIADLELALRELRAFMTDTRARSNRLVQARFRVEQLQQSLSQQARDSAEQAQRHRLLLVAGLLVLTLMGVIVLTLVRHRRLYRRMAFTDPLTGAANRRYTEVRIDELLQHAHARQEPLSLAVLDLDHFKSCNDRFGHEAGDEALRRFVAIARRVLRPGDLLGRWGGEEFLLVLPRSDAQVAEAVIDRLRTAAAAERLALAPDYPLRFSAGAVEGGGDAENFPALLARADQALYRAKAAGRNQTCFDRG